MTSSPVEVRLEEDTADQTVLGFPALATKNTTRVGGEDAAADAAGTATATYPGQTRGTRPAGGDARRPGGLARAASPPSALMGPPAARPGPADRRRATCRAPPRRPSTRSSRMGAPAAGGAQAIEIGDARAPGDLRARRIAGSDPFRLAAAIDAFATDVAGPPVGQRRDRLRGGAGVRDARRCLGGASRATPCCSRSATRFPARRGRRSTATSSRASTCSGPSSVISSSVERSLRRLGQVKRIQGRTPVTNAIAFARYADATFGWGVRDPGHGLVFANAGRAGDAAAAAALGGAGKYGPLLLLDDADDAAQAAGELPARHPARLPLRPGARRLQPRLDPGRRVRDQPRCAGADRRAVRDRARARRRAVTATLRA